MEVLTESFANPDEAKVFGEATLDLANWQVSVGGQIHRLEPRVADLLRALTARPGAVVTRDALIGEAGSDEALSQAVTRLRRILGDDPKAPRYIATVPRVGYRWIAPVGPDASNAPQPRPRFAVTALLAASVVAAGVLGAGGTALWLTQPKPQKVVFKQILITRGPDGRMVTREKTVTSAHALDPSQLKLTP